MKKAVILLLLSLLRLTVAGQQADLTEIEYGERLMADDSIILVTGSKYRPDGFGDITFLYAFGHSLNKKWKLKFDKYHSNSIQSILLHDGKIIISGLYGKSGPGYADNERFVLFLDYNGKVLHEALIGKSWVAATNLLVVKNKLYCSYMSSGTTYQFGEISTSSLINMVEMDLRSKKYEITTRQLPGYWPQQLIYTGTSIYVGGNHITHEPKTVYRAFLYRHDTIPSRKEPLILEYPEHLGGFTYENGRFVVMYYSKSDYRFVYLTGDGDTTGSKMLSSHLSGVSDFGSVRYNLVGNDIWFYSATEGRPAYFACMDTTGLIKEKVPSADRVSSQDFLVLPDKIIHLFSVGEDDEEEAESEEWKLRIVKREQ